MNGAYIRVGQCSLENAVTCGATGSENSDLIDATGLGIRQWVHLPIVEQIGYYTKQVKHDE